MRTAWACFVLGLACVSPTAPAQEKPAAPPVQGDAEKRPPAGRNGAVLQGRLGERLRRPGGLLERLGERLADPGADLDVEKLNAAIDALLAPLSPEGGPIERIWFDLRADQTDFENDKLAASAGIALRRSPWSNDPSQLSIDLMTQVVTSEEGRREIRLRASIELDTAVLPLVNFALPRIRDKLAADDRQAAHGADAEFMAGLRDLLGTIESVESMDELADLFAHASALRLASWNSEVDRRRAALAAAPDDESRRLAAESLLQGRIERDRLFAARPHIMRDVYGAARELHVEIVDSEPAAGLRFDEVEAIVSVDGVRVTAAASVTKGVELYELTRPLVVGTLRRLQNGDAATVATMREAIERRLQQAEVELRGEQ